MLYPTNGPPTKTLLICRRLAVVTLFAAISVLSVNRFLFGVSDNVITIPFLKHTIDPSLYANDYLIEQKQYYYTYLWRFCAIWIKAGVRINVLFFVLYCIFIWLEFLAMYLLTQTLFERDYVASLALFFLLFGQLCPGGVSTVPGLLLTRTVATPLALLAVALLAKRKYTASFALQGVAFLVHPMTVLYVFPPSAAVMVFDLAKTDLRKAAAPLAVFLALACPIILWKLMRSPPSLHLIKVDDDWMRILRLRSSFHLFPFSWPLWRHAKALLLLASLALGVRFVKKTFHRRVVMIFLVSSLVLCAIGTFFAEVVPVAFVLNLQLLRSFVFIAFFALASFAAFLLNAIEQGRFWRALLAILLAFMPMYAGVGWTYAYPAFVAFGAGFLLFRQALVPKARSGSAFVAATLLFSAAIGAGAYSMRGKFSIACAQDPLWLDVQRWARANTAKSSVFIVPPTMEGFRVESERAIYGDWKDGTLSNFNPDFGREWLRRMKKLGFRESFPRESLRDSISLSFERLGDSVLSGIAAEFGEDVDVYLVTTKAGYDFPPVYRNDKFWVYAIRGGASKRLPARGLTSKVTAHAKAQTARVIRNTRRAGPRWRL